MACPGENVFANATSQALGFLQKFGFYSRFFAISPECEDVRCSRLTELHPSAYPADSYDSYDFQNDTVEPEESPARLCS